MPVVYPTGPAAAAAIRRRTSSISAGPAYRPRGQKKPRRPSPRRRGTTCAWRCGTLWLTRLLTATKEPSAPSAASTARAITAHRVPERRGQRGGQVDDGLHVLAGDHEAVAGEERAVIEERHHRASLEHEGTRFFRARDPAEEAARGRVRAHA